MSVDHENCEKVIRLEAKVEELKDKVSCLDKVPEALMKISTTLEYTIENSERSDQLIKEQTKALYEITEKHGQTLNEISSNMKLQTQTIERLNTKLDETNESLNHKIDSTDAKVAEIDKKLNSEKSEDAERWSIHFSEIFKFVFWAVLGGAVAVLIPKLFAALAS